jgi:hypothetical protein
MPDETSPSRTRRLSWANVLRSNDGVASFRCSDMIRLHHTNPQSRRANKRRKCYPPSVRQLRSCTVSIRDLEGVTHTVRVEGESLFEAAARAVAAFREQGWAADALTANAVLHIEVHAPSVVHEVPLRAVERWLRSPSVSPKEAAMKIEAGSQSFPLPNRRD